MGGILLSLHGSFVATYTRDAGTVVGGRTILCVDDPEDGNGLGLLFSLFRFKEVLFHLQRG